MWCCVVLYCIVVQCSVMLGYTSVVREVKCSVRLCCVVVFSSVVKCCAVYRCIVSLLSVV